MPETTTLLETALENEAKLFLKLINALENDALFAFINRISALEPRHLVAGRSETEDILHIAQNVKAISEACDNFYVA
jgi:hypothetical protein